MELLKKSIHTDRVKADAVSQFTLEDDRNIPDSRPDAGSLELQRGEIVIEEVKPGTDMVSIRGRMDFAVLYDTPEGGSGLVCLTGNIPFEEKIRAQGITPADAVQIEGVVEDLSVTMINSRKLNIQALVTLRAWAEEIYDEEAPVSLSGEEAEYCKCPVQVAQLAVCRNDIFRIKEEVSLPGGYPNIFQLLWNSVTLGDVEFRAGDGQISVQGDVHMSLLYEGEGEQHPVRCLEVTLPFSGALECHDCAEGMIPDIRYCIGQKEITIRPDLDGEERCIGLELTIDLAMKVYEEESLDVLCDIYGVKKEIRAVGHTASLSRLLGKVTGKTKVTDHIRTQSGSAGIFQLLYSEGKALAEETRTVENGIEIQGILAVHVMYVTGDDARPYASTQSQIPFHYRMDMPGISEGDPYRVHAEVEQLQVTMLDGEEMDVKAVLAFHTTVLARNPMELIGELEVSELDPAVLGSLPGIAVYVVKPGDNLWSIGRKYYVSVEMLRKWNELESDTIYPGQKLLIVKGS